MSYVKIEDTAISSADVAEVTAKNRTIKSAAAPDFPNRAVATEGAGSPAEMSAGVRTFIAGS